MTNYIGIDHVSVLVRDTAAALAFYCNVLGMTLDAQRPDLGFPGAWLQAGGHALHLLQLPSPDPTTQRPAHGGRDRHVALNVRDLAALRTALDQAGIAYTLSGSGRRALFCRDPDGNALEFVQRA
jgi:glyoxylase I family protein